MDQSWDVSANIRKSFGIKFKKSLQLSFSYYVGQTEGQTWQSEETIFETLLQMQLKQLRLM
jgi:hypothetical protein